MSNDIVRIEMSLDLFEEFLDFKKTAYPKRVAFEDLKDNYKQIEDKYEKLASAVVDALEYDYTYDNIKVVDTKKLEEACFIIHGDGEI